MRKNRSGTIEMNTRLLLQPDLMIKTAKAALIHTTRTDKIKYTRERRRSCVQFKGAWHEM